MFYFSDLKNKKIVFRQNNVIGKLEDLIFLPSDPALITKIVAKKGHRRPTFPIESVIKIGKEIKIRSLKQSEERNIYELSLIKNVLDKQIIDVKGGKVVRANDVLLQERNGKLFINGVDIGFRAVLRWLKLERLVLPLYKLLKFHERPHFLQWSEIEPLELARGKVKLKHEVEELEKMRPEDLADYLEQTNIKNVDEIINNLDEEFAADVIEDLNPNYQTALFERFSEKRAADLLSRIDIDEAVDILLTLNQTRRKSILKTLPVKIKKEVQDLISYSKTPIGEIINPKFIWVYENYTLAEAENYVKKVISDSHFSFYTYIKNFKEELVGVMDLSELIMHPSKKIVRDVMVKDVIVIHLTTPKEIVIKKMLKYKLSALPVIDNNKHLLGVVQYDDLVEDILKSYENI